MEAPDLKTFVVKCKSLRGAYRDRDNKPYGRVDCVVFAPSLGNYDARFYTRDHKQYAFALEAHIKGEAFKITGRELNSEPLEITVESISVI